MDTIFVIIIGLIPTIVIPIMMWRTYRMNKHHATRIRIMGLLTDSQTAWFGLDLMRELNLSSGWIYPALASLERERWIFSGITEDGRRAYWIRENA